MKNLIKIGALALLMAMTSISLQAQQAPKFGYINSNELLQQLPEVKAANAELETLQQQLGSKIQKKLQTLQAKYEELSRKEKQGEISPKELQVKYNELREEELALQQEERGMQDQLLAKREELYSPILDKIQAAIEQVARENNYLYIFDYSAGFLLYADESQNVGPQVKAKIGL